MTRKSHLAPDRHGQRWVRMRAAANTSMRRRQMVSRPGQLRRRDIEADAEDASLQVSRNVMTPRAIPAPVRSVPGGSSMQLHAMSSGWTSRMRDVRAWASRGLLSETGGMRHICETYSRDDHKYGDDASTSGNAGSTPMAGYRRKFIRFLHAPLTTSCRSSANGATR